MSFILDALRKSEHDRQRQSGPALAEVPVAPRKTKTNVWATAAVALLIVNLIGVGVLLLRRASHEPSALESTTAATPAASAPAASTPVQATPVPAQTPQPVQATPQPTLQTSAAPPVPAGRNPLEAEVSGRQDLDAAMAASAASVPAGPPAVSRTPAYGSPGSGAVRYEPIPEATVSRAIAAETRAMPQPPPTAAQSSLPTADELAASGGVPPLHLDLHVYSTRPQERIIFVNSHKYHEGDALQEGPTVEQITPQGAVLAYRGSRFLLTKD